MSNPGTLFSEETRKAVAAYIAEAEKICSGEIRVFVDENCPLDPLDRAAAVFEELGMHATKERNGILIYLSVKDKKIAIIGDAGIHARVHKTFWQEIKDSMVDHFREEKYQEGLKKGISICAEMLARFFPPTDNDVNELPNDMVFGND